MGTALIVLLLILLLAPKLLGIALIVFVVMALTGSFDRRR
jgi:hypothetical protein